MNNNKLIAEFMGYPNVANDEDKKDYLEDCVQYHSSWDWLMPVVEKISHRIEEPFDLDNLKYAFLNDNIEVVYDEVVELIKEYNKLEK